MTFSEALREEYRKGGNEKVYELVKAGLLSVESAAANLGITTAEVRANVEKLYKN